MSAVDVRPSAIEGLGLFAARPFRAGQRIREVNVVREIRPDAPLRPELGERADHRAGLYLYLEPLATLALAVPLLGEPFGLFVALGGSLVLAGVYVGQRERGSP